MNLTIRFLAIIVTYGVMVFVVERKKNYRVMVQEKFLRKNKTIKGIGLFVGIVLAATLILTILNSLGMPIIIFEVFLGVALGVLLYIITLIMPKVEKAKETQTVQRVQNVQQFKKSSKKRKK